jgi:fructose-1,6-bisphosphatase class II
MINSVISNYKDFLIASEKAAISAATVRGKGDGKLADKLATDSLRISLNKLNYQVRVVIGEGERDEAPMLYIDEILGNSSSNLSIDLAVDPLECTTNCAQNLPNSMSVMVVAKEGSLLSAPDTYMMKICGSSKLKGHLSINYSTVKNLQICCEKLNKKPEELKIVVMDRERHLEIINDMRSFGVNPILISDGDVSAGIEAAEGKIDLLYGIGAAPEGVITAAAAKALNGFFLGKLVFQSDSFLDRSKKILGEDIHKIWSEDELCIGQDYFFIASGVCDGWIKGVKFSSEGVEVFSKVIFGNSEKIHIINNKYSNE